MRIVLVSQEYPPETAKGGIGTQALAKAQGLSQLGHEIFVISRSIDSVRHEQTIGNLTVIRVPGVEKDFETYTEPAQWVSHSLSVAKELQSLAKKVKADLIEFPEWAAEGYVYLLNRAEWNYIPVVIHLHGPLVMLAHTVQWPSLDSEFYRQGVHLESSCIKLADAVYSSSECSATWIKKFYDNSRTSIPIIHLGVDTKIFAVNKRTEEEIFTIVFTGKIVPNKGVEELIMAGLNLVSEKKKIRIRLLGRGEEKYIQHLKNIIQEKEAPGCFEFPGFVEKTALPAEYSKADVFVAPSWYEGGPGFVYLEAMACGLPVIACSGSGVDEIIEHGSNGFLVTPRDITSLTDSIRFLYEDSKTRMQMGDNARKYVVNHADTKDCLVKLENFYKSILSD